MRRPARLMLRKPETYRDRKYLAFVRGLPCCVCSTTENVVPHHATTSGTAKKGSDLESIPLCHYHHDRWHGLGRRTFCEIYNIDAWREIARTLIAEREREV